MGCLKGSQDNTKENGQTPVIWSNFELVNAVCKELFNCTQLTARPSVLARMVHYGHYDYVIGLNKNRLREVCFYKVKLNTAHFA